MFLDKIKQRTKPELVEPIDVSSYVNTTKNRFGMVNGVKIARRAYNEGYKQALRDWYAKFNSKWTPIEEMRGSDAGGDYASCDYCGAGKILYDANIDWENTRIGMIRIMCKGCYDKEVKMSEKINYWHNSNIHANTSEWFKVVESKKGE